MMRRTFLATLATTLAAILAAATALAQTEPHAVMTDVISHEATQDIHVWAPATEGAYPVVYAIHGTGGLGTDWDVLGPQVAANGVVVFATDYHSTDYIEGRWDRMIEDLECGYRYVREIAPDYGGDLDQAVAFVGHSIGATLGLGGGLDDEQFVPDGTYDTCFSGAPRPGAIVAIAGCYYEHQGRQFPYDPPPAGRNPAHLVLVGGANDEVCEAWQSEKAAEALRAVGHDASYVEIPGANHLTLIGHDFVEDEWRTLVDEPAAAAVSEVILEAIDAVTVE